jgi:uncharacterized protein
VVIIAIICACAPRKPTGFVMDNDHVFTAGEVSALNKLFLEHEHKTTNEIAVYTTATYGKDSNIHDFGTRIGKELGVGKKGKNNGVIIILCISRRQVNISTGKGTEKVLKDEMCKRIIVEVMNPEFKKGNYFEGVYAGGKAIIEILERPGNEIR